MHTDPVRDLVYGPIDEYLVFMPRTEADRLISVRGALYRARTWAELKQALPADTYHQVVELLREQTEELDDGEELPDDWEPDAEAEFDAEEIPGFLDGDWPAWPAHEALTWVPRAIQQRYGRKNESILNGDYLELDAAQEQAIVAAFIEHGYTCSRDDMLVQRAHDLA